MKTAPDDEDEHELRGVRAILSRPEARAHYKRLGQTHWIQSFIESGDRVFRRLGMKLLLREIVDLVEPGFARSHAFEEPAGRRDRRRTGRATCDVCGQIVSIKNDGTFRSHGTGALRSLGTPCRMSGLVPPPRVNVPLSGVRDAGLEVDAIRRSREAVLDADIILSVRRVTAEHSTLIVNLASRAPSHDPFWAFSWPTDEPDDEWPQEYSGEFVEEPPDTEREAPAKLAAAANPNWVADLARAEAEDYRARLAAERKERREERERARTERLERAARIGIVRRP